MKIIQISTHDFYGGAARAAHRLTLGLRQIGHDCRMVVKQKRAHDNFVIPALPGTGTGLSEEELISQYFYNFYLAPKRSEKSNTPFSFPFPGYDLSGFPAIKEADAIHLHWICDFQSLATIEKLLSMGKPAFWTLHDQWPFTGGCHYTAGCENYLEQCDNCPQLIDDDHNGPLAVFHDKLDLFERHPITIITPSVWMADCCRNSKLFAKNRIEVIPNSLETDVFFPQPKKEAKKSLGIGEDVITILFCAEYGSEKRKGQHQLIQAINVCKSDPEFCGAVENSRVHLICMGHPGALDESLNLPLTRLGYVESEEKLCRAYSAADLFVLPSLEDNLPNTMLESMSCATPVLAFDTGGIPEAVTHNVTGIIVPRGDSKLMGQAIAAAINNPGKLQLMSRECRRVAEQKYALQVQAQRTAELYMEELGDGELKLASSHTAAAEAYPIQTEKFAPVNTEIGANFRKSYAGMRQTALKNAVLFLHEENISKEKEIEGLKSVTEDREQLIDKFANLAEAFQKQYGSEMEAQRALAELRLKRIAELNEIADMRAKAIQDMEQELERLRGLGLTKNIKVFLRPRLGTLYQYPPREMYIPTHYHRAAKRKDCQTISIVTPSFNQQKFIERTIQSVLDQDYPTLEYFIQDGQSQDGTIDILKNYDNGRLQWASAKDEGQADAINKGFSNTAGSIMAYLNSDDLLLPGALLYVADYFDRHPEVDVVYGHRIVIDENDAEIGRWVMPPHDKQALLWADFIPQETLFWRREIWDRAGGLIDKSFKFALDWDLLLRFQTAGANFKRLPRFLGAFRVHPSQKTSSEMEETGNLEMARLRKKNLGRGVTDKEVRSNIRPYLLKHVLLNKLYRIKLLRY